MLYTHAESFSIYSILLFAHNTNFNIEVHGCFFIAAENDGNSPRLSLQILWENGGIDSEVIDLDVFLKTAQEILHTVMLNIFTKQKIKHIYL